MHIVRRLVLLLAAIVGVATRGFAQVVRGSVTEQPSGGAVAGALVELLFADSTDVRAASGLTDPQGGYALRAPTPGRYLLTAKRIGVRRFTSAQFVLAAGETRTMPIVLERVEYRLPEVMIVADAICSIRAQDRSRVAALWEEARTALDAAEISLRDRLFTANVTRYVRELEPKTLRVLNETRSEVRGVVGAPLVSLAAESLSTVGYWTDAPGGGAFYYGPDAKVLLSDTFRRDHCFRPIAGRGARQALTGLAFAPVTGRPVPDVVGTIWLDAKTFELQLMEFSYDRVRAGVDSAAIGGEVHFARLSNGAWIVRRWFVRVPVMGRPIQPLSTEGSAPWVLVRPTMFGLSEEGGVVTTDELRAPALPATIDGVVRDSTGSRPLRDAVVRMAGTPRFTRPDSAGRFAFDSVSPGALTLVVQAAGYDSLGLVAADAALDVSSGDRRTLTLTAHDSRALTTRLCHGRAAPWGRATLHVTLRDSLSGAPLTGVAATLRWMSTIGRAPGDSVPAALDDTSDARGHIAFCEVPSDRVLTLTVARDPGGASPARRTSIRAREVQHLEVLVGAAPPNE